MTQTTLKKIFAGVTSAGTSRIAVVVWLSCLGIGLTGNSVVDAVDPLPDRLWPLPIEPAVSSSFCEYRDGHFHAGIDVRTFGREGIACRASGDGYVSRVRASAQGYGKALYILLDTGETLVYAHLSEFSPALEDAVYEEQLRAGRYEVDFRFTSDAFPVKQGDVIAYSGRTGTTDPHLHFEIRDAGENPLNPFSHGFALEDKILPTIERVFLVPLDGTARINGRCYPAELDVRSVGAGLYLVADTPFVEGAVGIEAEIADRLNPASGKLAPYQAGLLVDGDPIAELQLERFSFGHTGHVDFLYNIARVRMKKEYFLQLFERTGEKLWDRSFVAGGRLGDFFVSAASASAESRVREAVIYASDRAGNACELKMYCRGSGAGSTKYNSKKRPQDAAFSQLPGFYFFENMMCIALGPDEGRLTADRLDEQGIYGAGPDGGVYGVDQFVEAPVTVPVRAGSANRYIHLCGLKKDRKRVINIPALDLRLGIRENTLFTDIIMYASEWDPGPSDAGYGELTSKAHVARIGPYSSTLKNDFEISFVAPGPDSGLAVYRLNERKMKWVFYESTRSGGVVSTTAKRPGVYAVLEDARAPRIGEPAVRTHVSYATGPGGPEIIIPIDDEGSGVDDSRTVIYIGEKKQIARWDDKEKKMFILIREPNIIGLQKLSVAAYDRIGNRSKLETTINVRRSHQQGDE